MGRILMSSVPFALSLVGFWFRADTMNFAHSCLYTSYADRQFDTEHAPLVPEDKVLDSDNRVIVGCVHKGRQISDDISQFIYRTD